MLKNFFTEIVGTFAPEEKQVFRDFLASPFFNKGFNRQVLIEITDIYFQAVHENKLESLEKQQIFGIIYPEKPFLESKFDKLMSELKGLVETFLIAKRYLSPENNKQQSLDLATEFRARGLERRHQQVLDLAKKELENAQLEGPNDYLFQHLLACEQHEWQSIYNKSNGDLNVSEVLLSLESYFYSQKTEMLNRLLIQQKQVELQPMLESISYQSWTVPEKELQKNHILELSWEIHLLLKDEQPKVEGFHHLLKSLQSKEHLLKPATLAQYYTYLRNICAILIDYQGYSEFSGLMHEIQKDNLARGLFYYNGKIPPYAYFNITHRAININDLQWAMDFVESHKGLVIGENETYDFYRMNKALCYFAEKKYDEALDILPFGNSYSIYHLMARRLELKIYYETKSELLDFKINAFKMFIRRAGEKMLSQQFHELFANFINLLFQLSQSVGIKDPKRAEQLQKRILAKKRVADRNWLLEKAKELG